MDPLPSGEGCCVLPTSTRMAPDTGVESTGRGSKAAGPKDGRRHGGRECLLGSKATGKAPRGPFVFAGTCGLGFSAYVRANFSLGA